MAIDYTVSVNIPDGLFDLFGNDGDFKTALEEATKRATYTDIAHSCYIAEYDQHDEAIRCNEMLEEIFDEYDAKRLDLIDQVNRLEDLINMTMHRIPLEQMKELVTIEEVNVGMDLFSLLIARATNLVDKSE